MPRNSFSTALLLTAAVLALSGCASTPHPWQAARDIHIPSLPLPHESSQPKLKHPERVYLAYAKLQEELGNLVEARRSYEQVLGEKPRSVEAIVGLARLDHLAGRDAEAEQGFERALRLAPNDPSVLAAAGQFYADRKQWDRAVELLQQAVAAAPDNAAIRHRLAVALANDGQVEAALAHFSKTVSEAAAHYNVAVILEQKGQTDDAEKHLLQALVKNPKLHQAQLWLDEIRRRKETQSLLAGSRSQPEVEMLPPPTASGDSPPAERSDTLSSTAALLPEAGHAAPLTSSGASSSGAGSSLTAGSPVTAGSGSPPLGPAPLPLPATPQRPEQLEQLQNASPPIDFVGWSQ